MRYLDRNLGLLNIVLGVAFFVSTLTSFTAEASVSKKTREALLAGELVVYFRHGATTWSGIDQIEWPREQQRL